MCNKFVKNVDLMNQRTWRSFWYFYYKLPLCMSSVRGIACRYVVVLVESLAGSGHKFAVKRQKLDAERVERYCFDPISKKFTLNYFSCSDV